MSDIQTKPANSTVFNVPNQLTIARLVLAVVMFCVIPFELYLVAMLLFLVAAGTDFLDGWYARKFDQVTVLGRILDPFADKIIICGTFIYLVAESRLTEMAFGLRAWMVVVILSRELLVTVMRGYVEQQGGDFSAKMPGKLKMVFQCIAAAAALLWLSYPVGAEPNWVAWTLIGSLWAAIFFAVYSCATYVSAAIRALKAVG